MPDTLRMFHFVGHTPAGLPTVMSINGRGADADKAKARAKAMVEANGFAIDGEAETDAGTARQRMAQLGQRPVARDPGKPDPDKAAGPALPGEAKPANPVAQPPKPTA